MTIKYNQSQYGMLKEVPMVDSPYSQGPIDNNLVPPLDTKFMITEIAGDEMEIESSLALMITES